MKTIRHTRLIRMMVAALVVCMIASLALPFGAMAANTAVNDTKNGVVQVNLVYTDDDSNPIPLSWGTGFLINENTVLTSEHVVNMDASQLETFAESLGKTVSEVKNRLSVTITISRDITIPCSILAQSAEMDFAILRLSDSMNGKTPLTIRSSATVQQAEDVYAIGFPDTSANVQSYNTFTGDDATITQGIVNKIGIGLNINSGANTSFIQTSCNLDYGNSGGPMVDENGYVIGICQGFIADNATEYFYAVSIDQVTEVLDTLGIAYNKTDVMPGGNEPAGIVEKKGNLGLILAIVGVAAAAIAVAAYFIVNSGKKKVTPAQTGVVPPAPRTAVNGSGFGPAPIQNACETTVLSSNACETTVLSRSVNGGTLIRKRTGEVIRINAEQFIIGRERKGVNYCIADNSSISRNHVKLTVRGGVTYLTDLNAANGTCVNGVKAVPHQEVALKNGDRITLSDEELDYKN